MAELTIGQILSFSGAIVALIALPSAIIIFIMNYRKFKETSPNQIVFQELRQWQKGVEDKLHNDNQEIKQFRQEMAIYRTELTKINDLERLMLKSMKSILHHLSSCRDGENDETMNRVVDEIDTYLINR